MAPASRSTGGCGRPQADARRDPGQTNRAILLGNTRTEATDFSPVCPCLPESGAYNVYAVAESRTVRTLAGGVDVVPQVSFAELAARLGAIPTSSWSGHHRHRSRRMRRCSIGSGSMAMTRRSLLLVRGAEVLAAAELVDGKTVTTHWPDIDASADLSRGHVAARRTLYRGRPIC